MEIIPEVHLVALKLHDCASIAYNNRIVIDTRGDNMVVRMYTGVETIHATLDSLLQQVTCFVDSVAI